MNAFICACERGDLRTVEQLCPSRSELQEGLHRAIIHDKYKVVEYLLGKGPKSDWDETNVLFYARHISMVKFLIEKGANVNDSTPSAYDSYAPLDYFVDCFLSRPSRLEICRALLEAGADPNGRALTVSLWFGDDAFLRLFIMYGSAPAPFSYAHFEPCRREMIQRILCARLLFAKLPRRLHNSLRLMFTQYL